MATANPIGKYNFGKTVRSEIDYSSKKQPLVSACTKGTGNEQLYNAFGVTIDNETGNIYIADRYNHCIKVFDSTAKYLFKFGDGNNEGRVYHPKNLVVYRNRILISHDSHYILNYQLDGKFNSIIGKYGHGKLEFVYPLGLAIDESNGDVYICDSYVSRIQILSQNLHYKSEFGEGILSDPCDIKLNEDNIFILDQANPCLHIFNKHLVLQKNIISKGIRQQVISPYFFFIDNSGNILISDLDSNSILVLNSEFEFVHKISISNPMGIIVDDKDRIIVVSQNSENCLQIL